MTICPALIISRKTNRNSLSFGSCSLGSMVLMTRLFRHVCEVVLFMESAQEVLRYSNYLMRLSIIHSKNGFFGNFRRFFVKCRFLGQFKLSWAPNSSKPRNLRGAFRRGVLLIVYSNFQEKKRIFKTYLKPKTVKKSTFLEILGGQMGGIGGCGGTCPSNS